MILSHLAKLSYFSVPPNTSFTLVGLIFHICWLYLLFLLPKVPTSLLSLSIQNQHATQIPILLESLSQLLQMLQIHSFLA